MDHKTWIYFLFWLIFLSGSSAYFGLTGKVQIRDIEDIDLEAAYMAADEQDSVYLWNENGYYTAPSNEYERVVLGPQVDNESRTRGLRSKKNVGPRNPRIAERGGWNMKDDGFTPNDEALQTSPGSRSSIRKDLAYQRRSSQFQNGRPGQTNTRRYARQPIYYRPLTRIPRYPQPPYPIQRIRYPHDFHPYGAPRTGTVPTRYLTRYANVRPLESSRYSNPTPEQAVSRPVVSLDISQILQRRNPEMRSDARTTPETPRYANDRSLVKGDESEFLDNADEYSRRRSSVVERSDSNGRSRFRARDATGDVRNEGPKPAGAPSDAIPEIKPLFVTKDIPSIMKYVGVDEKGNAFVAVDDTDPSSFPPSIMSEAGSRATDLPPMVLSSEINKKNARKECEDLRLTRKQKKICKRDPGLPQVLREATATAVAECQYQFRFERWNCSTGSTRIHLLTKGNRETAFLFAISSAGLTHSIARACAEEHLERCSCDETYSEPLNKEAWMWGGCGDNVHFAAKFVRQFLRPKARSKDIRAEVDKHNSDLGIRVVRQSVQKTCKCHGVSGSCTTKTCWRKVAPFYAIGEKIKGAYNRSVKVGSINSADGKPQLVRLRRMRRNRPGVLPSFKNQTTSSPTIILSRPPHSLHREIPNSTTITQRLQRQEYILHRLRDNPRSNELVYLEHSPQYCRRTRYSLGTRGRFCEKERNCDRICCGRGYEKHKRIVKRSCECEVRWCCYVECKTCTEERVIYTCK